MVSGGNIQVKIDGERCFVPLGTSLLEISSAYIDKAKGPIVAARVNNRIRELTHRIEEECEISFIDLLSDIGVRIYCRSLTMVLIRAAREVLPGCRVLIEHSLSRGLYGEIEYKHPLHQQDIDLIESRMREIIDADEPIIKELVPVEDAMSYFESDGQHDKARLLKYRKKPTVKLYKCGWMRDYYYGYMLPSTGYLKLFRLCLYLPGFILMYPKKDNPFGLPDFIEQRKLARVFHEAERWGHIIGVGDTASLNERIESGEIAEVIRLVEALHEKKISQIADTIHRHSDRIKLILIAGPSSSGKTTFAQRLSVQMKVNGMKPIAISLDNYFVDREDTPVDKEGNKDFDSFDALDTVLFNDHLVRLIQGEDVEVPIFNFHTGRREKLGMRLSLGPEDVLVIEGIHALNPRLTAGIPNDNKFRIYVSALTQLNLDSHNRIPTTDTRLIRRIVRDSKYRSHDAVKTLRQWPSVRRGEEINIFPYQEEADVIFNSALVYELAVLKRYIEPLLLSIPEDLPEYAEAKRLNTFLQYFQVFEDESDIPPNSILREFIGNSCFYRKDAAV